MLAQPVIQQQIDEAAFAIVHNKSFPGFKALNQKALYDELMPNPVHEFKMTGVRIMYNSISPCTFKSCTRQWVKVEDQNVCKCGDMRTVKKQSCHAVQVIEEVRPTCTRVTTLNVTEFQKPPIKSESNTTCTGHPETKEPNDECGVALPQCKPSAEPECETKPRSECEPDSIGLNENSCQTREKCSDPSNRAQSLNDTTDYDWSKFSNEISEDLNRKPNFNSTRQNNSYKSSSNNCRSQVCRKDQRKAETSAVDRSSSQSVNSSSNAVSCESRKETRMTVSSICESAKTDEYSRECTKRLNNSSYKILRSNEIDFDHCDVIENESDDSRVCHIEDVSMPLMNFDSHKESRSMDFPECESRDLIEDVSMLQMDYENSFLSDGCE